MEWRGGDVSGVLPYSRLAGSPGDVKAEEPTEIFVIPREEIPALIRDCYELTAIFVHVMVDRARQFTSSDLHEEKMSSLGKLAAGLAHELNNPASAVARSAKGLRLGLSELEAAARALGAARLSEAQQAAVDRARNLCQLAAGTTFGRSPIEQADREDALADWLSRHGADVTAAEALAESAVTLESLDELAGALDARGSPGDSPVARGRLRDVPAGVGDRGVRDEDPQPRRGGEGLHLHGPGDHAQAGGRPSGPGRHARSAQREGPRESPWA